ncbi:unnamed protein product [Rhizoctonia solani]|uniref:Uncharacterized protein n=1 Tax=Rhizoctonia solani TaxID=456999 RepID=A0A8H2WVN1_9AGAM|nr:unnamed protein product [Rhizoctonia solani]
MLDLLAAVPPITPFLHFMGDILRAGYYNRRNERDAFVLHIKRIIALLDITLASDSDTGLDTQWVLNLRTKLTHILESLAPKNRSIIRRVRARWMCDEHFIHETNREIDTALRLIELHTVASLNGDVVSLRGGMEQLISIKNNSAFRATLADSRFDGSTLPARDIACQCGGSRGAANRSYASAGGLKLGATTQWDSEDFDQVLNAAYQNVLHHRHLAEQDRRHRPCLANALSLLVQLYQRAGRVGDALEYSLEANRLLGTMAQDASLLPENSLEGRSPLSRPLEIGVVKR